MGVSEGLAGEQAARLQSHLAACADCRRYAEELRSATAGLRWLTSREVEPSPGFRARWTRAVEDAARPTGLRETAAALAAWWRELLLRNLRPALGVASLWILALLFRLSAPEVPPTTHTAEARSPVEIVRALETDQRLVAWHLWGWERSPAPPRHPQSPQPRSESVPAQPAAQLDHEPDAHTTAEIAFPNLVARGDSPAPASVWKT